MARLTPAQEAAAAIKKLVDDIVELDHELQPILAPIAGKIKKLEALRKQLRDEYVDRPADMHFIAEGSKFDITLGGKTNETYIFTDRLLTAIGEARFLKIATVTKKALEDECERDIVRAVTEMRATGYRVLKVIAKAKDAAA